MVWNSTRYTLTRLSDLSIDTNKREEGEEEEVEKMVKISSYSEVGTTTQILTEILKNQTEAMRSVAKNMQDKHHEEQKKGYRENTKSAVAVAAVIIAGTTAAPAKTGGRKEDGTQGEAKAVFSGEG